MSAPNHLDTVVVHPDHDSLAAGVAARLVTAIIDAQADHGVAHVALTGGRIGTASLAAVLAEPARKAVAWANVEFWWSDERFEPAGDPLRNETDARSLLLDHLPIDPTKVHPMPPKGGVYGDDVDAAAAGYAAELAAAAGDANGVPRLDVAMLGVGPDGHVASLFPGLPGITEGGTVIPVRDSPKPPPVRISFTLGVINSAARVWLIASGADKATAMAEAIAPTPGNTPVPAALVRGTVETLALLDPDSAAELPN